MSRVEIKLNRRGVNQVLKSPSMRKAAEKRARQIAAAAGPGYAVDSRIGRRRARASVFTKTYAARLDNSKRNTLLKSIGAARRG